MYMRTQSFVPLAFVWFCSRCAQFLCHLVECCCQHKFSWFAPTSKCTDFLFLFFFYKESTSFIHIYHGSRYKLHLDHLEEITTKHIILQIHKSSSLPFYEHQYSISCFHGRFPPSWSLSSPHPTPLISLMIYGHRDPSQASITTLTIAAIVAIHEFFDSAASMSTFINPWGGGIHRGNWACTHTNIFFVPLVYIFFLVSLIYFYNPKRISWHV